MYAYRSSSGSGGMIQNSMSRDSGISYMVFTGLRMRGGGGGGGGKREMTQMLSGHCSDFQCDPRNAIFLSPRVTSREATFWCVYLCAFINTSCLMPNKVATPAGGSV